MKKKLLAFITALVFAFCFMAFAACNDNDEEPNGGDERQEPSYETLTNDQFKLNMQGLASIENYVSNVSGYKFNVNLTADNDDDGMTIGLSVILDASVLTDVSVSAHLSVQPLFGQEAEQTLLNVYLYGETLYVDLTSGGITQKDSIGGIGNDVTELLSLLLGSGEIEIPSFEIPDVDVSDDELGEYLQIVEQLCDYFGDYLTIKYCAELGHYEISLLHPQGGSDGTNDMDAFTATANMYVKNNRLTSVNFSFVADEFSLTASLEEYKGRIDYPAQPDSYEGELLDALEVVYNNRDLSESAFYGEWVKIDDETVTMTIDESGVTIGEQNYYDVLSYSVLMLCDDDMLIMITQGESPTYDVIVVMSIEDGTVSAFIRRTE